ncbi:MAG: hypothetical protein HY905_14335 [Deltaproteobacteria bacterium]|nr:hypothetical protein [Deltaproteobacteria bacterium]
MSALAIPYRVLAIARARLLPAARDAVPIPGEAAVTGPTLTSSHPIVCPAPAFLPRCVPQAGFRVQRKRSRTCRRRRVRRAAIERGAAIIREVLRLSFLPAGPLRLDPLYGLT